MRYGFQAYVFLLVILIGGAIQPDSATSNIDPLKAFEQSVEHSKQALSGFKVEPVSFEVAKNAHSDEKFIRKGFLALRPAAVGTVIICHGYTQSKLESFFLKTMLPHFNVLAFDFRAHGDLIDEKQFSTIGRDEIFDVEGAVAFVKSHPELQGKPIFGFGFSMGAVALLQAQAEFGNLFDALILDSPFDSSTDCMSRSIDRILSYTIFGRTYRLPGKKLLMKAMYNDRMRPFVKALFQKASGMNPNKISTKFVQVAPIEQADKVTIPCMFISCENDKSVLVDCVRRLYDTVHSSFKRLWITQGPKHCGSCLAQPEQYSHKVNKFLKKVLDRRFDRPEKIRDDRVTIQAA